LRQARIRREIQDEESSAEPLAKPMTTHTASRLIAAPPERLYAAFLDPEAVARWRPPTGMRAQIERFEARQGGGYRMAFVYQDAERAPGKTRADADVFEGVFAELVPGRRIVEQVTFESDDPAFAAPMTVTTTFEPEAGGARVSFRCEDVPAPISEADHVAGMAASLAQLAAYAEGAL
jgi:uncharacterized protein YndB with AHSA1/START domain